MTGEGRRRALSGQLLGSTHWQATSGRRPTPPPADPTPGDGNPGTTAPSSLTSVCGPRLPVADTPVRRPRTDSRLECNSSTTARTRWTRRRASRPSPSLVPTSTTKRVPVRFRIDHRSGPRRRHCRHFWPCSVLITRSDPIVCPRLEHTCGPHPAHLLTFSPELGPGGRLLQLPLGF